MKNKKILILIIILIVLLVIILLPKKISSFLIDEEETTYLLIEVDLDDDVELNIELTHQENIEKVIEKLNQYYCIRWVRHSDVYDEGVSLLQATGNYNWGSSITITKDNYVYITGKDYKIISAKNKNLYNDLKDLVYQFNSIN